MDPFQRLDADLLHQVLERCDVASILNVAQTCTYLKTATDNALLWLMLYERTQTAHPRAGVCEKLLSLISRPFGRDAIGWSVSVLNEATKTYREGKVVDFKTENIPSGFAMVSYFGVLYEDDETGTVQWETEERQQDRWYNAGKSRFIFKSKDEDGSGCRKKGASGGDGEDGEAQKETEDETDGDGDGVFPLWSLRETRETDWRALTKQTFTGAPRKLLLDVMQHKDEVLHVAFSDCGRFFSTCSRDRSVLVYSVESLLEYVRLASVVAGGGEEEINKVGRKERGLRLRSGLKASPGGSGEGREAGQRTESPSSRQLTHEHREEPCRPSYRIRNPQTFQRPNEEEEGYVSIRDTLISLRMENERAMKDQDRRQSEEEPEIEKWERLAQPVRMLELRGSHMGVPIRSRWRPDGRALIVCTESVREHAPVNSPAYAFVWDLDSDRVSFDFPAVPFDSYGSWIPSVSLPLPVPPSPPAPYPSSSSSSSSSFAPHARYQSPSQEEKRALENPPSSPSKSFSSSSSSTRPHPDRSVPKGATREDKGGLQELFRGGARLCGPSAFCDPAAAPAAASSAPPPDNPSSSFHKASYGVISTSALVFSAPEEGWRQTISEWGMDSQGGRTQPRTRKIVKPAGLGYLRSMEVSSEGSWAAFAGCSSVWHVDVVALVPLRNVNAVGGELPWERSEKFLEARRRSRELFRKQQRERERAEEPGQAAAGGGSEGLPAEGGESMETGEGAEEDQMSAGAVGKGLRADKKAAELFSFVEVEKGEEKEGWPKKRKGRRQAVDMVRLFLEVCKLSVFKRRQTLASLRKVLSDSASDLAMPSLSLEQTQREQGHTPTENREGASRLPRLSQSPSPSQNPSPASPQRGGGTVATPAPFEGGEVMVGDMFVRDEVVGRLPSCLWRHLHPTSGRDGSCEGAGGVNPLGTLGQRDIQTNRNGGAMGLLARAFLRRGGDTSSMMHPQTDVGPNPVMMRGPAEPMLTRHAARMQRSRETRGDAEIQNREGGEGITESRRRAQYFIQFLGGRRGRDSGEREEKEEEEESDDDDEADDAGYMETWSDGDAWRETVLLDAGMAVLSSRLSADNEFLLLNCRPFVSALPKRLRAVGRGAAAQYGRTEIQTHMVLQVWSMRTLERVACLTGHHAFTTASCPFSICPEESRPMHSRQPSLPTGESPEGSPSPVSSSRLRERERDVAGRDEKGEEKCGPSGAREGTETGSEETSKKGFKGQNANVRAGPMVMPEWEFAASGGEDKRVCVWDVRRQRLLSVLEKHEDVVNCVSWSKARPGLMVSVSDEGRLCVWGSEALSASLSALSDGSSSRSLTAEKEGEGGACSSSHPCPSSRGCVGREEEPLCAPPLQSPPFVKSHTPAYTIRSNCNIRRHVGRATTSVVRRGPTSSFDTIIPPRGVLPRRASQATPPRRASQAAPISSFVPHQTAPHLREGRQPPPTQGENGEGDRETGRGADDEVN
uniref:Uncharacterized protein n=1 Tax=Chromera velia CCMP2878 TaxID=1169474 RepID=A0A0G4EZM2_9ALVE|eukprot:Cvel_14347.t1-p1 / transcript=Cvel_14347.t1 / gene=Cvel_14347 / organism=Chromera_velia_CCMP2878 / gene_product=WD repeat-containing protein 26 homolog, putative / transcript_product=WD repeat-containing protein 26 homolog, putative / location=Cvel_scaffold1016:46803-56384(+) / protein_length=1468 / sequence_SO=supercontig / SO=protein_coding / is_pseudo=false